MSTLFRYKEFPVYKDSLAFTCDIRKLSKRFPSEEKFALVSQVNRATDSIVLNIAEGTGRYSDLDFSRFLNQANASLYEVVACLDIALALKYISSIEYEKLCKKAEEILKQLTAFTAKLRNSHNK